MSLITKKRVLSAVLIFALMFSQCFISFTIATAESYSTGHGYFHDQGGIYMSPVSPTASQSVTLKLRVPHEESSSVKKVYIRYTTNSGSSWTDIQMSKNGSIVGGAFDLWQGTVPATSSKYYYKFKITKGSSTYYFSLGGLSSSDADLSICYQVWPGFSTPDWSHGQYWYYVPPTCFYNGDSLNDVTGEMADLSNGQKMNAYHHASTYGGDVQGVSEKVSYIKDLGCTGIYLNPLFVSTNAIGYGIVNNYMFDSQYTTENRFKQYVNAIHNADMKVMFDVLAHSVIDANVWFNSYNKYPVVGAYNSTSSPYRDMFYFESNGLAKKFLSSNALDYANSITKKLMYQDTDSYLSRYLDASYDADALRFDAGSYLYGTGLNIAQITSDMTSTLKSKFPNKLLICENLHDSDGSSYTARKSGYDGCWNTNMMYYMRNLAEGSTNVAQFRDLAIINTLNWPRAMALSDCLLITSHDAERLQNSAGETGRRMARIFQMTYVGSPMLYYGDEIDAESMMDSKIEQFDWNTDNWNMNTYNLVKGLGKLRNEYTCLREGVVKFGQSDTDNNTISFARWDSNGTVISLLNGKDSSVNMTVNVRQFEVPDDTVLTDYFTGRTYTVSSGSITASVVPGGTVLVTGGNTATSVGKYTKTFLTNGSGVATISNDGSALSLTGYGAISNYDSGLFVYNEAHGGFELSANVNTPSNGAVALAIKSNNIGQSQGYFAWVNGANHTVKVYRRSVPNEAPTLLSTTTYTGDSIRLKLVRSGNNHFSTAIYNNSKWNTVAGSEATIEMPSKLYAGSIQMYDSTTVSDMTCSLYDSNYYDGFLGNGLSSEFTYNVDNYYYVSSGRLNLVSSGLSSYLSDAPRTDWTAKASIGGLTNTSGHFGVAAYSKNTDYVFAGRFNNQIVLARRVGDDVAIYDSVVDTHPSMDLTVQLQKTGNFFTASYRYVDEKNWKTFSNRIFASYTTLKYGIVTTAGQSSADYITLGNMIDSGASMNTPISKDFDVEFDYKKMASASNMVKWDSVSGTWSNVVGGLSQTSASGDALYFTKSTFTDLRAEASISVSGTGYSAILFSNSDKTASGGYMLKLNNSNKLSLVNNGVTLAEKVVSPDADGNLRVIIERIGNRIIVYTNQTPEFAFSVVDATRTEGYFGFATNNATGYFGNYNVVPLSDAWTEVSYTYPGGGATSYSNNCFTLSAASNKNVAVHRKGVGYTDVFASINLNYVVSTNSYAGLGFAASENINPIDSGIVVAVKDNSSIVVLKNGVQVASTPVAVADSISLSVEAKEGCYKVYTNNMVNPVLTYSATYAGGTVCALARNTTAYFTDFVVDDISDIPVYESLGYNKAVINLNSRNVTAGLGTTLVSPTDSVKYTSRGYSYTINNTSGMVNTEYFALDNSGLQTDGAFEVSGVLRSGASTTNSNMTLYNAPTIVFRSVNYSGTAGYLKLALTKSSGGMSIIFDNDYYEANNRKYLTFFNYDNGTYIRDDTINNYFRIVSDNETVSVWLNGYCVLDKYNYSANYTNLKPAVGVGYNCCSCSIEDFCIKKVPNGVIVNSGSGGSIELSDNNPTPNSNVVVTKDGTLSSGLFSAYSIIGRSVNKISLQRIGYRKKVSSVDKFAFNMPSSDNPVVLTCDFSNGTTANIATLGAQYRASNNNTADIRFGIRLGCDALNGTFTVNGSNYSIVETGTLVSTVTAFNTLSASHEDLMKLNSSDLWGDQYRYLKKITRTKFYDYCDEYIDYVATITNIPQSKYDKVYVARGYIIGADSLDNQTVFYTDIIYRSVNDVIN